MTGYTIQRANRVRLADGTYYGPNLTRLASTATHELWYRPGYMGFAGQGMRRQYTTPVFMLVRLELAPEVNRDHTVLLEVNSGRYWRRLLAELRHLLAETDRCQVCRWRPGWRRMTAVGCEREGQ